ncbi:hypothetical protein QTG54_005383 [Skeletonema marinoi]|uniref:Uncharacterized protein n=1 Tax=Skeletonema marinoi TaxID=267567 RepID=A0AAD9DDM5_9STRA|nr:hypothetical protein QTG54_005383 [Skeletonema marinoi]
MKTWTIAPVVMDSMPPRGGERIIKTVPGVMRCFKKKIIGRYPRSFLGQGRCHSRVVSLPFLLQTSELAPLPTTQFWIIRTTTSPSQSCTSKDSGVTTSRSATNCRNRPPKSENGSLQTQNQKVEHENRILKRAVTIQQDRQHQVSAELEGIRTFKEQAEERIRRLEQMNLTLQYQLQAQNAGNDFMGFRPPDVY